MDAPTILKNMPGMMHTLPVGIGVNLPGGLHCSIFHNFGLETPNPLRLATEFATLHGDTSVDIASERTASA